MKQGPQTTDYRIVAAGVLDPVWFIGQGEENMAGILLDVTEPGFCPGGPASPDASATAAPGLIINGTTVIMKRLSLLLPKMVV
jgi:hypothetical protein